MASKMLMAENIQKAFRTKSFNRVLEKVKIISASNGSCLAEMTIEDGHTNSTGTLHGGLSITLVDVLTAQALWTETKGQIPTVSINLALRHVKPAKLGDVISIEARAFEKDDKVAFGKTTFRNKETGDVLVEATHTLYMTKPES